MTLIQADSSNFTKGRVKAIDHLVIHYTGNDGDTAKGNCTYFQGAGRNASANYFVDENEVLQSVKDGDSAWHAGNWDMNCRSIGIEMCSAKSNGAFYIPEQTQKNASKLAAELMKKYGIGIENVIRHYDVTGKKCPEPFVREPAQWQAFKNLILSYGTENVKAAESEDEDMTQDKFNEMMDTYLNSLKNKAPADWSKDARAWAEKNGIIAGDEKGNMNYKGLVTREQLVTFLQRVAK